MTPQEEIDIKELQLQAARGLTALYLEAPAEVVKDVKTRVEAYTNALQSQFSTALSEALALRVENERLEARKKALVDFIINNTKCQQKHPSDYPHCARCNALYPLEVLSQPTPTGLTDKLLRLVVAARNYVEMGKCTNYDIGYQKDYGAMHEGLKEAAEALTPDEVNMIEVILK